MDSRSTLCKTHEVIRASSSEEPMCCKHKNEVLTVTNIRSAFRHPKLRVPLNLQTRTNRAYELRMGAAKRYHQNLTPSSSQGSIHLFQHTNLQKSYIRPELRELEQDALQRKRHSTAQFTVESNEHEPRSKTATALKQSRSLSHPSSPVVPKSVPHGTPRSLETGRQSLVASPHRNQCDDVTETSVWDSNREYHRTQLQGIPVNEPTVTLGNQCEYPCEISQILSGQDSVKHKQLYHRHFDVIPLQKTNCSLPGVINSLSSDVWKDPDVIQMNSLSKWDSKAQIPQSPESDPQIVSQIPLVEIKSEEFPVLTTIKQSVLMKTDHPQSVVKMTGDKATETNGDDFSPYTCPSLSMEDEVAEVSCSPVISMSAPKAQIDTFKSPGNRSLFTYAQSQVPSRRTQYLCQNYQHQNIERAFTARALPRKKNYPSKIRVSHTRQNVIRAFFGCWKAKLTNDEREDVTTRSPYSQIDTLSQDPSLVEERRTPKVIITKACRGSKARCSSVVKSGDSVSPVSSAVSSVSQTETLEQKAQTGSQPKCPTPVRIHVNAKRGQYPKRTSLNMVRLPISLARLNKRMTELVKQQNVGVKVFRDEITACRTCLRNLTTQITTMTQTLTEQRDMLKQITKFVESREPVPEGDGSGLISVKRSHHSRKSSLNGCSKLRPPRSYLDTVETPNTVMPVDASMTVTGRERSHHHHHHHRQTTKPDSNLSKKVDNGYKSRIQECQPNSAVNYRGSPKQPPSDAQCNLQNSSAVSSEDYTIVTENYSKQSKESSLKRSPHAASRTIIEKNNSISILKPSALCDNEVQEDKNDYRYFSELAITNTATAATTAVAHTDVVCHSQPMSSSTSEITEATIIEGNDSRLNQANRALRHYYRIDYVEQDNMSSHEALFRNTVDRSDRRQFCLQKELPRTKLESTVKEAKLVATEFVPCPQGDSEDKHIPVAISSSRYFGRSVGLGGSENKLTSKSIDVSARTTDLHSLHHHKNQNEQPIQISMPTKKVASTCRRRKMVGNDGDTDKISDPFAVCSTHNRTAFISPGKQICIEPIGTVLRSMETSSNGTDKLVCTGQNRNSRLDAEKEKEVIKSVDQKLHQPCPKQRHKSTAAGHMQKNTPARTDLVTVTHNLNQLKRHGLVENNDKHSAQSNLALNRNNNSQDWSPGDQTGSEVVVSGKSKHLSLTQVAFDQLNKKTDLKLQFVTSKLQTLSDNSSKNLIKYALPGSNEDESVASVVQQHLSARRERTRVEKERQLWKELQTIGANRRFGETKKINQLSPQIDSLTKQMSKNTSSLEIILRQQQQQQQATEPSSEVSQGVTEQMTTLEKCREQRRRRLEEKIQEDMRQILVITEQAVAERRNRTLYKGYGNYKQICEPFSGKPNMVDDIGDGRLKLERSQELVRMATIESNANLNQSSLKSDGIWINEVQSQSRDYGIQTSDCEFNQYLTDHLKQPAFRTLRPLSRDSHSRYYQPKATTSFPMHGYLPWPWVFSALCNYGWVSVPSVSYNFPLVCDTTRQTSCPLLSSACSDSDSCESSDTPTLSSLSPSSAQTGYDESESTTTESSRHSSPTFQTAVVSLRCTTQPTVATNLTVCGQSQNYFDQQTSYRFMNNRRIPMERRYNTLQ